jgi:beta-glucosidase
MQEKIQSLIEQMTLEEKVSMLAGADFWRTVPVERLNIPAFKVTDGPNGARGEGSSGKVPSACFPVGVAMGATWNVELIERVGKALGDETKAKSSQLLLAPTVNIHRSPLAGRNFECYSEDPYLTARAAVAYINGVQSVGVGACIKHFIANDSEFERHTISSEVSERALREIYLYPFMVAVPEAKPWSVMSSYNKINGVYAAENAYTLINILKEEWQYEGFVISDWFGTQSTVDSANNGLDLEMPGPAKWMGDKLLKAVKDGQVSEDIIDDKIRRLLRILIISGLMDNPGLPEETTADSPEQRALIREAAGEAMVLLKNDNGVLPIKADKVKKLAIIGPNAKAAVIMGGGSSHVTPYYSVTPYEGVIERAGDSMQVDYSVGVTSYKQVPLINSAFLVPAKGGAEQGVTVDYFNNLDVSGDPVYTESHPRADIMWIEKAPEGVNADQFSARLTATFTPDTSGTYTFSVSSNGLNRLFVDGEKVIDCWQTVNEDDLDNVAAFHGTGAVIELVAGQRYDLKIDYAKHQKMTWTGIRLGCVLAIPADAIEQAAKLAAECDTAVIFAGLNGEWESEGYDRPDMELTPGQNELIEAVAAANPNTVVVLNVGSPVTMPWLDKVASVLIAWFPGQEAGNAMADVLFGDVNPSGKLPTTFPKRLEDTPAYINYPGENGQVFYGEGIFVGYRYYEKKKVAPLFPFGHGLSYTRFEYSNLTLDAAEYDAESEIKVSVDVKNTGSVAGQEVVQLYVREKKPIVARPNKELRGYKKVMLQPGETQTVEFSLDWQSLAYYDTGRKGWAAQAGKYKVLVGSSSADIRAKSVFTLKKAMFGGEIGY